MDARERRAREMGGTGRIDGRRVVVGGDDFTVRGGASDAAIMAKQLHAERRPTHRGSRSCGWLRAPAGVAACGRWSG